MFRDGKIICGLSVADGLRLSRPPVPVCSANIVETTVVVVCSRVCRASVGAFAAYEYGNVSRPLFGLAYMVPTASVPEFGGLTLPFVMASQI
jgi:hypothetical protein